MAEGDSTSSNSEAGGDRRGRERRKADRRQTDRRFPVPVWRRPSAFVAYGVVGALALVLLFQGMGGEEEPVVTAAEAPQAEPQPALPEVQPGQVREASGVAGYETLIAEGDRAVGQVVRTELFCGSLASRTVRVDQNPSPTLLALADAEGRVGGTECRWGRDGRSDDFLLIVPSALAADFASAPEVELNFVTRRNVTADVEWLGRSEALALRYAGVLREIVR